MSISFTDPLILVAVGIFLYYRPLVKTGGLTPMPKPGKYPGHIEELFSLGKLWFEDPMFFLKRY